MGARGVRFLTPLVGMSAKGVCFPTAWREGGWWKRCTSRESLGLDGCKGKLAFGPHRMVWLEGKLIY